MLKFRILLIFFFSVSLTSSRLFAAEGKEPSEQFQRLANEVERSLKENSQAVIDYFKVESIAKLETTEKQELLAIVSHHNNIKLMKVLLENGASTNGYGYSRIPPLRGVWKMETAKFLVEHGADVNAESEDGNSILQIAATYGEGKLVSFLIEKGARVNGTDDEVPPLHAATLANNTETITALLVNGADLKKRYNNKTALDVAREFEKPEAEKLIQSYIAKNLK